MDDSTFDDLTRAIGGTASRRAALAALAGLAAGGALENAAGKRRRRRCRPACAAGQTCVQGECACDDGGTPCGAACCLLGQDCRGGACVTPAPGCVDFGQPCKNVGRPCCDGLACGSGQGGQSDVACYVPAGGPCEATAQCTFDSTCTNAICIANPRPTPTPAPTCTPTFPATADAAANGAALRSALLAADPAQPLEIVLAAGEYAMPNCGWQNAESLTIRTCPGAIVTLRPDATYDPNDAFFSVRGASATLDGLVLAGENRSGTGVSLFSGTVALRQCTVKGFSIGVFVRKFNTATVVGGDFADNSTSLDQTDGLTGAAPFVCSESPRAAYCCLNDDALATSCGCTSNCA